jgi:hypothetical protein
MPPQIPVATPAGETRPDMRAPAAHLPAMPSLCRSPMPDQEIVIWTPARLAGVFFAALHMVLSASRLVSRASADDAA